MSDKLPVLKQNMSSSFNSVKQQVMNSYNEMNQDFASYFIYIIIAISAIFIIIYYSTLRNLQSSNCNSMNQQYPDINKNIMAIDNSFSNQFSDYYINTAYNACSGGTYKNGFVDLCNLKAVIREGVRCLDFAIYNENDEPVVATSTDDSFFVKETYNSVGFSEVMKTIYYNAFSDTAPNKTDPVIIHLRIKSNNVKIYDKMAGIFKLFDDKMTSKMTSYANYNNNFGNIPLNKINNKIVLIVDGLNNTYLQSEHFFEYVNIVSNSNYLWLFRYYDIVNNPDIDDLTDNNKYNATIVLPDSGNNPSNPSGLLARSYGCQMIAMRYQYIDSYLEENNNFFNTNGYAFVLKPANLRAQQIVISEPVTQNPSYSYQTREVKSNLYSFKY
jgi:hypothetical protein